MKRILAVFNIILILIFFIGTTAVYADITEEDISIVKNPDRGLYKLVQVELQNEEENFDDFEKKVDEINENDKEVSLILLELNLKNYVQENNISKNKIIEIKENAMNSLEDYKQKYGSDAYGFVAYILNLVRIYSIPLCFLGIAIGAIHQYVIGIRKLDTLEKGMALIVSFVTILIICQILPLAFAVFVKFGRG